MNGIAPESLWLLVKVRAGRIDIMTTSLPGGGMALPVFSFEDEAAMFHDIALPHDDWWVRETSVGELVSVLLGPCADVDLVLLDPLPGVDTRTSADLVGMGRKPFVGFLLSRRMKRPLPVQEIARLPVHAGAGW